MSGTRSVRPPGTGSGQGRTGSCVASTLWEKVKKCLWCFVFIWSWRVMSVRPSLWYTTESFYVCVCVRPPTWAGPDWIMFLNHSCNYVFVQLDQTVCRCVRSRFWNWWTNMFCCTSWQNMMRINFRVVSEHRWGSDLWKPPGLLLVRSRSSLTRGLHRL